MTSLALAPEIATTERRMTAVTVIISEPADSPEIDWPAYVASTLRLDFKRFPASFEGHHIITSWRADA